MNVIVAPTAVAHRSGSDPFGPANASQIAPCVQHAFDQVMDHIDCGVGALAITGAAGTGKTFLLGLIEDACLRDGLVVRLLHRGDLANAASGESCDVLLIDEADGIEPALLETLIRGPRKAAVCTVIACIKDRDDRFAKAQMLLIPIQRLGNQEAANYVRRVATASDLFTQDAVNLLVGAAGGSIRMLRMLAGMALFCAGRDGSKEVASRHVTEAFASRIIGPADTEAQDLSRLLNVHYSDVPLDAGVDEWNALCVDKRLNQWAATPTLAGVCFKAIFQFLAGPGLVTAATAAILMFAFGPGSQLLPRSSFASPAVAGTHANDLAEIVSPAAASVIDVSHHDRGNGANGAHFARASASRTYAVAALGRPLFPQSSRGSVNRRAPQPVVSQELAVGPGSERIELSAPFDMPAMESAD
jgi:hypothetical protein